jgi:hypothetical protein
MYVCMHAHSRLPSVSNTIVNIAWDRDDMLFILVEVVIRLVFPFK